VVKVLDQEGKRLFISHLHGLVERAMPRATSTPANAIFDYENDVRLPAMALKEIYESLGDVSAYALMCGTLESLNLKTVCKQNKFQVAIFSAT